MRSLTARWASPLATLVALVGTTSAVSAQASCTSGPGPAASLATRTPFSGGSVYGHPNFPSPPGATYTGFSFLFDMTITAPIDISQIDILLYDAGGLVNLGNGTTVTMPNQVGATTNVEFYIYPAASWLGQEASPGSWGLVSTGTLTVATSAAHSVAVFNAPIGLGPGLWGCAFKVDQTTSGPAPGPLHPLLDPTPTVPGTYSNADFTMNNLVFQRESWTNTLASAVHEQNIEIHYTRTPGWANWTSFGTGCVAPNEPVLGLTQRPVIGTAIDFQATNIQAGTLFNFWLLGFAPDPAGFDLTAFGMPGCSLYLQIGALNTALSGVSNGAAQLTLPIPNSPTYSGIVLYGQAAPLTAGSNPAGFFASNAVCAAIGAF